MQTEYQQLPEYIDKGTFELNMMKREGDIALFSRYNRRIKSISTYEVAVIRKKGEEKMFDVLLPNREVYPSTSEWGKFGWTYQHLVNAEVKFRKLVEGARLRAGAAAV